MLSRSIHVVTYVRISFHFCGRINNSNYTISPLYSCITWLIHLSGEGHLGYFHLVAIVNNAARNKGGQVCARDPVLIAQGMLPELALPEHVAVPCVGLWGTTRVFHSSCTVFRSHQGYTKGCLSFEGSMLSSSISLPPLAPGMGNGSHPETPAAPEGHGAGLTGTYTTCVVTQSPTLSVIRCCRCLQIQSNFEQWGAWGFHWLSV